MHISKGLIKFGFVGVLSIFLVFLFVVYVVPVLAEHSSDSNVITPGFEACNVLNDYTLTVTQTGGPDSIYNVRIYNRTTSNPFPDQQGFDCGSAPSGWVFKGFTSIGTNSYCEYETEQDPLNPDTIASTESLNFTFSINITQESVHPFRVSTIDTQTPVGFQVFSFPNITVDCTDPVTTKSFIGPQKIVDGVEWIDGVTKINLTAIDSQPHPSGVDKTWYINILSENDDACLRNESCLSPCGSPYEQYEGAAQCINEGQEICDETWEAEFNSWEECVENFVFSECEISCDGQQWKLYTEPFQKEEESCHILQFFSVDNVSNVEEVNDNCFFVDKTPPVLEKDNGQAIPGSDVNPPIEGEFHFISPSMPITFTCTDQEPHPSGDEEVCFKVSYDKEPFDLTSNYCSNYGGAMGDNGFCCVDVDNEDEFQFNFNENEDSVHDLEYYCKDAVNKTTDVRLQWYKVDTEAPVITKEMFGSWLGDCPPNPEPSGDVCYAADDGSSGVNISAKDIGHGAEFGVDCTYEMWLNDKIIGSGEFKDQTNIVFFNDSTHTLKIWCEDVLGNQAHEEEEFLVDSTPPETTKMYGEPVFTCQDWCELECGDDQECTTACLFDHDDDGMCGGQDIGGHWYPVWINSNTMITLSSIDEKVGVDKIIWRNTIVEDEACTDVGACDKAEGEGNFVEYTGPFNKTEQSCHLIEYFAVDKLGYTEQIKRQCAFVDNTPPIGNKTVGQPSIDMCELDDGGDGLPDHNSPGDLLADITMPSVSAFTDVGVAFDGTVLYVPDGTTTIQLIDPSDGSDVGDLATDPSVDLDAMAYDKKRDILWACSHGTPNKLYTVDVDDGTTTLIDSTLPGTHFTFCDGLAYDENDPSIDSDDRLWFSPDISTEVFLLDLDGNELDSFMPDLGLCGNSGIAVGGDDLYLANDGCDQIYRFDKSSETNLGLFSAPGDRPEDLECDDVTFAESAIWVRMYENNHLKAYEIEAGTCGVGGQKTFCGDGKLDAGEQCDDGNLVSGDGCSATCKLEEECPIDWAVSQNTPIWLTCNDQQPHPVDHESVMFKVSYEDPPFLTEKYCEEVGGVMVDGWCKADSPVHFTFLEDSMHDLEYFCEDALGNKGETDLENFTVETVPPTTNKTYVGPFYTKEVCIDGDVCSTQEYIDTASWVVLNATDPQPHPSGVNATYWRNTLVPNNYCEQPEVYCQPCEVTQGVCGNFNLYTGPFNKSEESCHLIEFYSVDNLNNQEKMNWQCVFVDKQPPVTSKKYVGPIITNETSEWISNVTNITLSAFDQQPHPSGVNATYWRNSLVDDVFCGDQELCQQAEGTGQWNLYTGPFNKNEQSCHLIEFYSVDNVNKTEKINKQCAFVDLTPPLPNKTVGEPKSVWDGKDAEFYNLTDKCWANGEGGIECWTVTMLTPITMDCNDQEPHPVDNSNVCFKVELDGKDKTENYCEKEGINGEFNETGDGFCCVLEEKAPLTIFFGEESEHNLDFYCTDALGNKGPIDEEKFKVEGTAFKIKLKDKWNLISVPFKLHNSDVEAVFNDTKDDIMSVWTYDGETGQWYVWTPGPAPDTLTDILPGWGYWVLSKNETDVIIGGSLFSPITTPPSRNVVKGWNLIGYYGVEWQDFEIDPICPYKEQEFSSKSFCALSSLVDTQQGYPRWSSIWRYLNQCNGETGWRAVETCPTSSKKDKKLFAGKGYWIEMDVDDIYAPATTCIWNEENMCISQGNLP